LAEKRLDFLGHCMSFAKGAMAQVSILEKSGEDDAVALRGAVSDLLEEITTMFGDPESGSANMESARRVAVKASMILSRLRGKSVDAENLEEDADSEMPLEEGRKRRRSKKAVEEGDEEQSDQEESSDDVEEEDSDAVVELKKAAKKRLSGKANDTEWFRSIGIGYR
jgi:hypothetical protein